MDYILRDDFTAPAWEFVPLETLTAISSAVYHAGGLSSILYDYFLKAFYESKVFESNIDGALERYYITADRPTVWQFDFTPKAGGETVHIEIEHADLSPSKIAELLNSP